MMWPREVREPKGERDNGSAIPSTLTKPTSHRPRQEHLPTDELCRRPPISVDIPQP